MQVSRQMVPKHLSEFVRFTPWDSRALGLDTFEILTCSEEVFRLIVQNAAPGHYTVRVDPLSSKKALHECGFYYCDTLIEPFCDLESFIDFQHDNVHLSTSTPIEDLISISANAFFNGRFHRDFNIDKSLADLRYTLWLKDIHHSKSVFGLMYYETLAGFWGYSENKIVLHALGSDFRGKGLSKYFWSAACRELFQQGHSELVSSISFSNTPALNLYISLGFKFRNSYDLYHLMIQ
ncbi:MAG: GNAT family N-acetyltransferase [Leptolyngbya sp.]|nr:MAG: GNAT family N-acetyltransferase [Leptolyngbya sp.]